MSRKRKRGKSTSTNGSASASANQSTEAQGQAGDSAADASGTTSQSAAPVADEATVSKRKQRRAQKAREKREARNAAQDKNKGIRPWILPGFAGLAIIAIVLVGVSTIGSDSGTSRAAAVPAPILGEPTAEVVLHEYADFQCPFCGVFSRTIKPQLQERFIDRGSLRIEWHDFAWYGGESRAAANAARCAGEQDQFWQYHDLLFERQSGTNQGAFNTDALKRFGGTIGLEQEPFEECVNENRYAGAIDADMADVRSLGLNGTPSFIIGDQRIIGAQPFEVFEQAILSELQG